MRRLPALLALLLICAGCAQPYQYHGMLLDSPQAAPDTVLVNQLGEAASLGDYQDKLVLLYFGYTFCPDVCPTTLSTVNSALELMGKDADQVQLVMITVDPERDTPEALGRYLAAFNPDFVGLSGTPEQIADAATPLGVYHQKHDGTAATGYLVDHTASLMVLDRQGKLRLVIPFETSPEDIADDLKHLLR